MKVKLPVATLVVLCLVLASFSSIEVVRAEPKTIVVPDDYPTISWAVGNATEGDTIFVKSGVYNETLLIDKQLILVGENQESTIINGRNRKTAVHIRADGVNVTGFTITNGNTPAEVSQFFPWGTRLAAIHIQSVNNCKIQNNKILNSGCGIWLYQSNNNQIVGNNITDNSNGIILELSSSNSFNGNCIQNSWGGVRFTSSCYNTFKNNSVSNCVLNLHFGDPTFKKCFGNVIDETNTIDGKPMIFWVNKHDSAVTQNVGDVILINCTGITIDYPNSSHNCDTIILTNTSNSQIVGNTNANINLVNSYSNTIAGNTFNEMLLLRNASQNSIVNNSGCIHLTNLSHNNTIADNCGRIELYGICSFNTIQGNNCSGQIHYPGVFINGPSSYNRIIGNTVANNELSGIWLEGSVNYTAIIGNNVVRNGFPGIPELGYGFYGIELDGAENTLIVGNNVVNNNIGVSLGGLNSTYYYNNFNNTRQLAESENTQTFDNGYPCGGNYWSNYVGTDNNKDGIGDKPFILSNNIDAYPLIALVTCFDAGTWEWTNYNIYVISNTTLTDFSFNPATPKIAFNLETGDKTVGFCRITVPKDFLYAEKDNWTVLVDGNYVTPTIDTDTNNSYLYFTYNPNAKTAEIHGTTAIPEFPSWTIIPLFAIFVLVVALHKKRLHQTPQLSC